MTCLLVTLSLALGDLGSAQDIDADACPPPTGIAVQVLGSGGPIADDARASAAYLVWIDGESRVLVDAGGGSFLRFGEAGASFEQLDLVAISHFHTDHSADLAPLLKSGYFSSRRRGLAIAGPGGSAPFPGLDEYLLALLGPSGAYAYLGGYLDGSDGLPELETFEVDEEGSAVVYAVGDLMVSAMQVPHGIVPSVAFRIETDETAMVFASDQNGNDANFVRFSRNADLLIMHMAVPEQISGAGRALHAPPSLIGQIAADAGVRQLVLSHFMERSLRSRDENIEQVTKRFDGELFLASDLDCFAVD